MVFLAENSCGLGTQGIRGSEDCLEMDWTETEVCIKCDKGGKLLVCSDSNCPLAVHEECMHCSTRFDSTGNFYCPYCSYKRAMLETRKARKKAMLAKKALSIFLDTGIVDGAPQKPQKAERDRRKVLKQSTAVGDAKPDDNRNSPDGNEVDRHFMPIEKDQCEETFDLCKRAKVSAVNEQNAGLDVGAQHKAVIEEHMRPGSIIACGDQNERLLQDEQQLGPSGPLLADRGTEVACAILLSITDGLDNADVVKEHEGSRAEAEAEVMQDQEKENPLSGSGNDFIEKEPAEDSDTSHKDNGYVSPHWRRIKKKQNDIQSPSVDSKKRSTRKSPKMNANVVHKEKNDAIPKSRLTSPAFPLARRKKLPWTSDEEEMLKEGVQKFSTTVNKNLPWRKILEFGHHVFHGTRTPADLKDKWRNILIKEGSTK